MPWGESQGVGERRSCLPDLTIKPTNEDLDVAVVHNSSGGMVSLGTDTAPLTSVVNPDCFIILCRENMTNKTEMPPLPPTLPRTTMNSCAMVAMWVDEWLRPSSKLQTL